MSQINLSAGVRSNLLSLQGTANMLERTQNRLATGMKVNGPLDDAAAFFTAQGLNSRANDLTSITQGMQNGMKTIEAASKGINSITKTMETMIGQVRQALQDPGNEVVIPETQTFALPAAGGDSALPSTITVGDSVFEFTIDNTAGGDGVRRMWIMYAIENATDQNGRSLADLGVTIAEEGAGTGIVFTNATTDTVVGAGGLNGLNVAAGEIEASITDARLALMNSFNDLRSELDALARDSGYNGNNLLMGDMLEVVFNELTGDDRNSFTVSAKQADGSAFGNVTADRLGGAEGTEAMFASNTNLEARLEALQEGVSDLRSLSSQLGTAQTIVENRESFTKQMVNTLQAGADGLTLADMNEEAANNLALQTKQQLGQSALALAIQNDQSVLQLLR
ncbi:MAG: flagellin N-terminal helical domain-containing protein [Salinarimonas sp.]